MKVPQREIIPLWPNSWQIQLPYTFKLQNSRARLYLNWQRRAVMVAKFKFGPTYLNDPVVIITKLGKPQNSYFFSEQSTKRG